MTLLPPTVEQQRRMDEELPPDPEMRKRDIVAIREWLAKQPHLPKHMGELHFKTKESKEKKIDEKIMNKINYVQMTKDWSISCTVVKTV